MYYYIFRMLYYILLQWLQKLNSQLIPTLLYLYCQYHFLLFFISFFQEATRSSFILRAWLVTTKLNVWECIVPPDTTMAVQCISKMRAKITYSTIITVGSLDLKWAKTMLGSEIHWKIREPKNLRRHPIPQGLTIYRNFLTRSLYNF